MNHVVLSPGQALYMAAGGVHAYIHGAGIELLANSDNVIRAGLTPKHIDVPELLRVLDPEVPVPVLTARQEVPGVERFDTPVPEFLLRRVTAAAEAVRLPSADSPRILLCTEGTATVRLGEGTGADAGAGAEDGGGGGVRELTLPRGSSCFLPASDGGASVTGPATLFMATPGPGVAA
jgi:mannose-6-phosphate isomerase